MSTSEPGRARSRPPVSGVPAAGRSASAGGASRSSRLLLGLVAGLVTLMVNIAIACRGHIYPFGRVSRGFGDYGTQYLAFHAAYRRLLLGQTHLIGPTFTWTSGGGVPFLPDYAYYLGGPITPLVALFPASRLDLAMATIITLRLCLAAALMALLLRRMRPGLPAWVTVVLATAYACSAWTFDIALYTPMWLDSLWEFPLLGFAALWCRERRRFVPAVLVVALTIWSNFYTGYMACLGAGVLALVLALTHSASWRNRLVGLGRFLLAGVLGVALMAWLLVPTLHALGESVPFPPPGHETPLQTVPFVQVVARLLPFTEGEAGTPALFGGSLALVLAVSLPFARHRSPRARLVWMVALVALLASVDLAPTMLVWNAFDVPNGNHFRFSFVPMAFLVLVAAQAWPTGVGRRATPARTPRAGWPDLVQALGATAMMVALVLWAGHPHVERGFVVAAHARLLPLLVCGVLLLAAAFGSLARWAPLRLVAAGVLMGLGGWELLGTAALVQATLPTDLSAMPILTAQQGTLHAHADAETLASGWPARRPTTVVTDQLPAYSRFNQGLLLNLPTLGYYSSNQPVVTRDALGGMGAMLDMNGRMLRESYARESPDTALRIILAVAGGLPGGTGTMPLARTLPGSNAPRTGNVFTNRNALLAEPVYTPVSYRVGTRSPDMLALPRRSATTLSISCAAGLTPTLQFSSFTGVAAPVKGTPLHLTDAVVVEFPPGTETVRLLARARSQVRAAACLDMAALKRQVAATPTPEVTLTPNHITARFTSGQNGVVTFVVPRLDGWSCRADGHPAAAEARLGFLAVPVSGASTVSCAYREPGVRAGLLLSVLTAIVAVGLSVLDARLRRSSRRAERSLAGGDGPDAAASAGASVQVVAESGSSPSGAGTVGPASSGSGASDSAAAEDDPVGPGGSASGSSR